MIEPVFKEMIRQAAQGRLFHNDDTAMKILSLIGQSGEPTGSDPTEVCDRKGVFTSGIVSVLEEHQVALFFTGHRHAGAPLDNNVCERALKKAILHRKNAYFYKTRNGARVGDMFMSLIHTCELNKVNPFDYLTELQKHANELSSHPEGWMPWNYRNMLQRTDAPLKTVAP